MSDIVHYEVYAYQNGAWDLLARYPSEQRAKATEYAKSIENSERKPTKVVRETYNLDTQMFQEAMVYLSEIPKPQPRKSSPYQNSVIPTVNKTKKKKRTSNSITEGVIMIFLSVLFSMMASAVVTTLVLRLMLTAGFTPQDITNQMVLGVFTFFFLVISIPTAIKWVNWDNLLGSNDDISFAATIKTVSDSAGETENDPDKAVSSAVLRELYETAEDRQYAPDTRLSHLVRRFFDALDLLMGRKTMTQRLEDARLKAEEQAKREEEADKAAEDERKQQADEADAETETEPADQSETEPADQSAAPAETGDAHESESTPPAEAAVIPAELEKDYLKLTSLLSLVLRVLQERNTLLNTYARFGIELFLAGACEQLCKTRALTKQQNRLMLSGVLELLGRAPALAALFFDKIDEYMLESKYLPVIDSGAKSMQIYMTNKTSPELIGLIQSTMSGWLNPSKKETVSSGVCIVMFTDIVSSTQMTQTLGDRLAQQLIHRHNTIVRQALDTCGGEEIKQTGDGIMASFQWASNAIDAAVAIQKSVSAYNSELPTVPLAVRIGLNAGEPIVENNDLFGLTVQIAARVCNEAGKDEIYVSSVVKELAAGKNYVFKPLGDFNLKGVNTPQTLYEVIWNTTEKPEEATDAKTRDAVPEQPVVETKLSQVLPEL